MRPTRKAYMTGQEKRRDLLVGFVGWFGFNVAIVVVIQSQGRLSGP